MEESFSEVGCRRLAYYTRQCFDPVVDNEGVSRPTEVRWRPPHGVTYRRLGSTIGLVVFLGLLLVGAVWLAYLATVASVSRSAVVSVAFGYCGVIPWVWFTWRYRRIGVYVSDYGVLSRGVFATHTLRWESIAGIESHPTRTAGIAGFSELLDTIWVVPWHEPPVSTRVHRSPGWLLLLLSHPSFGTHLPDESYDSMLRALRERVLAAQPSGNGGNVGRPRNDRGSY